MNDAAVVGAGPNGLAAAVALAQRGLSVTVFEAADEVGGGARTQELLVPGVRHDVCSAVHPFGVSSPFLRSLDLRRHGLAWRWPELDLAHPLDSGEAGVLVGTVEETAAGLGTDGAGWQLVFGPVAHAIDDLIEDLFRPLLHPPRHPVWLGRFAGRALQPVTVLARQWQRQVARALFAGVAAHGVQPLEATATSAVGLLMIAAGHQRGWPVAEGGSGAITAALASLLEELGGEVRTGEPITSVDQLPPSRVVLLDVAPAAAASLAPDAIPPRVQRAYRAWRYGPGVFKVDFVVDGGVPWTNDACRRAGTVHCGGTLEEVAAASRDVQKGRMPDRPFVIVGQQYLADPGRSSGPLHPVWAYAHVPHAYAADATGAVIGQIERFAPGLRDRIVALRSLGPDGLERHNPNCVGGDIATGANDFRQLVFRPRVGLDPYRTGAPGLFLCSAATPPGAAVHGMCGFNAAQSALRYLGLPSRRLPQ
jgi:phytoene dehydrogenase-like protein